MGKILSSTFELTDEPMTDEEIRRAFTDFRYYTSHCQQIVDKRRRLVYMRLNRFQELVFEKLLPMVDPETRLDRRHDVVFLKPRQVGATVGMIDFVNFILAYAEGLENFNVLHTFPATDTVAKIFSQKVQPIITGVHPDIMPTIEKEPAMSSTIRLHYKDVWGIKRNNFYDLVSANANSIRSGTANMWIADEVAFYRKPEVLEDAISPALPPDGFSLVVFASTFDDRMSDYFKNKIQIAADNPEDFTLIFAPWFMVYPEEPKGIPLSSLKLTEYDETVSIPAFEEFDLPTDLWGDAIDWYHRMSKRVTNMQKEYPTTLSEVMRIGENKTYFTAEAITNQRKNVEVGTPFRLLTDNVSGKVEAQTTDVSPFTIFRQPQWGERYAITVDPTLAVSEKTDLFCFSVWNLNTLEQVATYRTRDMSIEDYADAVVGVAKIYNKAIVCPEQNVAEALVACIRALGYYNFYYESPSMRAKKVPGIRTTASSKDQMLRRLELLFNNKRITLHDKNWVDELETFERIVKIKSDGSTVVKAAARKGKHDDTVATCWIFAGMLEQRQLTGSSGGGFTIL